MIVLDASALLEVLLGTPTGVSVERRMFAPGESLHAPHLIDLEVAQVLRRYITCGDMGSSRAEQAVEDLDDLPITRYPHRLFLPRIWALRNNLSAYDAVYVALAEALPAPLLTRDRRLAGAPGASASIEVIS